MLIIGFVGYKNSGKTHIAKKLKEYDEFYGSRKLTHIGFSDPFYEMLAPFGISIEDIQNKAIRELPDERLSGNSIQHALNTLGTDWGRNCMGKDFWTSRGLSRAVEGISLFDNVRFENELDGIRDLGDQPKNHYLIIHIRNDDVKNDGSPPESLVEYLSDQSDFIIDNTGQKFAQSAANIEKLYTSLIDFYYGAPLNAEIFEA